MSVYVKLGEKILKNPNIIRPHVKCKDISQLNFKKMKDMGMEKIIFGRNNVLTGRNSVGVLSIEVNEAQNKVKDIFGAENILLL